MRERMKKKKNMIIGGLLAIVFLMSVGYAAFASNLTIAGTANTSSWIIKITNIREKTKTAGVTNKGTSYTDLTANFNCELTLPGDSITYEVTVENQGNIDASLKEVTKSFTNDKYIQVTYSGLYEGQMLYKQGAANSTAVMEVTVTFKDKDYEGTFTDTITSNISLNLEFQQEGNNVDTTKKYLVKYDSQGGTPVESEYYKWEDKWIFANSERAGYILSSWYVGPGGSGKEATFKTIGEIIDDESAEGITLYAAWTERKYTIQLDEQIGGTITTKSISWTGSDLIPSMSGSSYNNGYILDAWYTLPNGKGMKVENNTRVKDIVEYLYNEPLEFDKNPNPITIYAHWKENEYTDLYYESTYEYIDDDGWWWAPSPDPQNMPEERKIKCTDKNFLNSPIPTDDNYIFNGWYDENNNRITNQSIKDIYGYCPQETTIYAHWTQKG